MDSLRYWVTEMHVDGFRFDLAGALARTEGEPDLIRSAFLTAIIQDPVLREVKLIAEPWDASPMATRWAASRHRSASGTTDSVTPSGTSGADGHRCATSRRDWPGPPTCTPTTGARPMPRSTS